VPSSKTHRPRASSPTRLQWLLLRMPQLVRRTN